MDKNQLEDLLSAVLECGYADLDNLNSCEYPYADLVREVKDNDMEIDINTLTQAMFSLALQDVQEYIDTKINDLEEFLDDYEEEGHDLEDLQAEIGTDEELSEDDLEELKILVDDCFLDIMEDAEGFYNYMDTSISIIDNEAYYTMYFPDALELFEDKTGFSLI